MVFINHIAQLSAYYAIPQHYTYSIMLHVLKLHPILVVSVSSDM